MKKFFISTMCFFLISNIWAQEKFDQQFQTGMFGILTGLSVNSFSDTQFGGMLAAKYYISPKSYIRVGAEMGRKNDFGSDPFHETSTYNNLEEADLAGVFAHFLYYVQAVKPVKLYLGGGPTYGNYDRLYKHSIPEEWPVPNDDYKSTYNQWYIGIDGKVGVEWLATRNFSIGVEYGISYKYFDGDYEAKYVIENRKFTTDGVVEDYEVIEKSGKASSNKVYGNEFIVGASFYF